MASWPPARSRSRTTSPPRPRGAGRSSRPSTSTHRPSYDNTSSSREQTTYRTSNDRPARWQSPDRHVLIIINFQDLADLSARLHPSPNNADYLDAECRVHLGAIDEVSLFTWCRHFDHREAIQIPIYAIFVILFRLVSGKLGISAVRAPLWNFVVLIIGETPSN